MRIMRLVKYLPCFVVITLFFYPDIMKYIRAREFPSFDVMGFGIRLTEIILFMLFFFMVLSFLRDKTSRDRILILSRQLRSMRLYLLIVIAFLILGFFQGYLSRNPILLLDIRGMSYIVFVPVFISSVRSISQIRRAFKIFYIALIILSISNLATINYDFYGTVGKYSNLTVQMSLYLFCLSISFSIYFSKNRLLYRGIAILSLLSILASLMKFAILSLFVAIIGSMLLIDKNNRTKLVKSTFALVLILILSGMVLVKSNLGDFLARSQSNSTLEDLFYERYLRSSIGDISSGRFAMWNQIFNEAIKRPFIGKGLGVENFKFETIEILVHEHNIIFWSMRRFGLIGAIIFILLGIKFYNFAFSVYRGEENPINKAVLYASLVYCLAYLFINLVSIMVFTFESAVIFWLNVSIVFLVHREQLAKSQIAAYGQLHRTVLD